MSPASEAETMIKGAKRPAPCDMTGNASKKQRGRPRVVPTSEDGTAADKRRTQIRLAQRAYRQRKETTIASCKHQVTELKKIIQAMNVAFAKLNQKAIESGLAGLNHNLVTQLELTAQEINAFSRQAEDITIEVMPDDDQLYKLDHRKPSINSSLISITTLDWNELQLKAKELPVATASSTVTNTWGFSTVYEPETKPEPSTPAAPQANDNYIEPMENFDHRIGHPLSSQEYFRALPHQSQLSDHWTSQIFMAMSLPSPHTYSFNETTFARRLHRACLEDVFSLLSNPGASPDIVLKKFRFSLPYSSLLDIRNRLRIRLSGSATDPLELSSATQYNRNDQHHARITHSILPNYFKSLLTTVPHKSQVDAGILSETDVSDGWLTPEDVQKYVESKGFCFNPYASFVEGEIAGFVPAQYPNDIGSDNGFLQSPPKTPDFFAKGVLPLHGLSAKVLPRTSDIEQTPSVNLHVQTDVNMGTTSPSSLMHTAEILDMYTRTALMGRRVVLDINRFLNELVEVSVCRGRSPGLHYDNVERAFQASIISFST